MRKLLSAPDPAPAVAAMSAAGVLAQILPGADARALPVLVHLEGDLPPWWLRRLAVLGGEDPADRLRLSRAEAADLAAVRDGIGGLEGPDALGFLLGVDRAAAILLARAALSGMTPTAGWQAEVARGAAAQLPISAKDLPDLSGPALGQRLKELRQRWLDSGLRLTKAELLA